MSNYSNLPLSLNGDEDELVEQGRPIFIDEGGEGDGDAMLTLANAIIQSSGRLSEGAVKAFVFLRLYLSEPVADKIIKQITMSKIRQTGNSKFLLGALLAAARDKMADIGVKPGGKS